MMDNEFNFFRSFMSSDKELFFGPLDNEEFIEIQTGWTMANIVCAIGVFPSVSQARNNGYNKPIPAGFSDLRFGKRKVRATILNVE